MKEMESCIMSCENHVNVIQALRALQVHSSYDPDVLHGFGCTFLLLPLFDMSKMGSEFVQYMYHHCTLITIEHDGKNPIFFYVTWI